MRQEIEWPVLVSLQPLVAFNDALIDLSYRASTGKVARGGNAPPSSAYQAGALLLSYRALGSPGKMAEAERIELPRPRRVHHGFQDR